MVVALVALFVALGGGAYAASHLPPNSITTGMIINGQVKAADIGKNQVRTKHIKSGSVRKSDIRKNAITTGKIKAGAVESSDIADNAVTSSKIPDGAVGSSEIADGSVVDADISGVSAAKVIGTVATATDSDTVDGYHVGCPTGTFSTHGMDVCMELEVRGTATSVWVAFEACHFLGRELPSALTLRAAGQLADVTLTDPEMSSSIYIDGGVTYYLGVSDNGGVTGHTTNTDNAYRCTAPLVRTSE